MSFPKRTTSLYSESVKASAVVNSQKSRNSVSDLSNPDSSAGSLFSLNPHQPALNGADLVLLCALFPIASFTLCSSEQLLNIEEAALLSSLPNSFEISALKARAKFNLDARRESELPQNTTYLNSDGNIILSQNCLSIFKTRLSEKVSVFVIGGNVISTLFSKATEKFSQKVFLIDTQLESVYKIIVSCIQSALLSFQSTRFEEIEFIILVLEIFILVLRESISLEASKEPPESRFRTQLSDILGQPMIHKEHAQSFVLLILDPKTQSSLAAKISDIPLLKIFKILFPQNIDSIDQSLKVKLQTLSILSLKWNLSLIKTDSFP
ncbi:hypothetical protein HK096_010856, partial [Nowakowskiella sp. JEL0078]